MSEKNINEKTEEKAGKEERKPGVFAKLKPIAEGAVVGFVSGALILGSCTKFTDFDMPSRHDAGSDAQVSDVNESDGRTKLENVPRDAKVEEEESEDATTSPDGEVEEAEEAVEEELADVPEEEVPKEEDVAVDPDAEVERDAPAEIVEDEVSPVEEEDAVADQDAVEEETPAEIVEDEVQDVAEDEGDAVENDVVTDVGTEEEVQVSCDAHDATRLVILRAGDQIMIGGIMIRYDGLDASNNAVFSLLCNDVEVKTNIVVPVGTTYTEDVNEQRFRVTFNPRSASSLLTNVTITVDAY